MNDYEQSKKDTKRYKEVKKILKDKFGYDNFRQNQYKIIDNLLDNKDVLAILPTSHGKSLCYEIPPLITKEVAIIISPLISLMEDQMTILQKLNINVCSYNSTLTIKEKKEVERKAILGEYSIIYITPESLLNRKDFIEKIYQKIGICLVAIDEAHCVSSFGFDFRPAYREIVKIRKLLVNVPFLATTATATLDVIEDIKTELKLKKCEVIKSSFDRPNLYINVKNKNEDTILEIAKIINDTKEGSIIIYCITQKDTEMIADKLRFLGISILAYHGGMKQDDRTEIQNKFMTSKIKCISATVAFGMGINKDNVRNVIHYGRPQNIEGYYQEIGRGGRDGNKSNCYLFCKKDDFIMHKSIIEKTTDKTYKKNKMILFEKMMEYTQLKTCRKKFILNYFDEDSDNCNNCDNCCNVKKEIITLTINEQIMLENITTLITDIYKLKNYNYGISMIVLILKGSNNKKIEQWMKDLKMFAILKNIPTGDIIKFIEKMIELGYMKIEIIRSFNVLTCSQYKINIEKLFDE